MKKTYFILLIVLIFHCKSNATVYPVDFDAHANVTCQVGDTLRFYTVNWTTYQFDLYINQNLIASNLTPGAGGKIYDYVAQLMDTCYGLTNTDGLFIQKSIHVNNGTTGILQNSGKIVGSVYPNPVNVNFVIETNTSETQNLQIFDVTGKMVLNQTVNGKVNIDASNLDNGVYFMQVKTKQSATSQKIIVQH